MFGMFLLLRFGHKYIVGLVTKCRTCKIPKLHFSAFWPSYRLPHPTALIPGHLANQKVEIMSCDKMPNLRVVIQKNTETAFLKNCFLIASFEKLRKAGSVFRHAYRFPRT